ELIATYRAAWKSAGHPGQGTVMIAFHMLCAESKAEADRIARAPCDAYFRSIVEAAGDWAAGTSSKDYKNYDKMIEQLRKDNYDTQVASGGVWAGEPNQIVDQIHRYQEAVGGFEVASMQTNFYDIGYETAARSMKLFGEKVIPQFR
ncbi:MAG: LLM class flavin-dependent oxidoreductase, partial [Rhodospirillales bacterium]